MSLEQNENEEIDLGPLFGWFQKNVQKAWTSIVNWLGILLNKWKLLFVVSLITAGIAVALSFMIDPYYESELTIRSGGVDSKLYFDRITTIDMMLEEENYAEIASLLSISEEEAMEIHSMEYERLLFGKLDTTGKPYFSKVIVTVFDNKILDSLQKSIINYLSDIPFIQRNKSLEEDRIAKMIKRLNQEIFKLDSLKTIIANSIILGKEREGLVYGEPMDPVAVYQESIDLYERKLKLELIANTLEPVEVVTSFNKFTKPAFPKKKYFAVIGGLFGFLLTVISLSIKNAKA